MNNNGESRNHRNWSRLALDSQVHDLSQISCTQLKLKIAVAPPAFSCIFSWLKFSCLPAKKRGPVFLSHFITLARKLLLFFGFRKINCGSPTINWCTSDFSQKCILTSKQTNSNSFYRIQI